MWEKVIVDADFCIKIGASQKYLYLEKLLTKVAKKVYIHEVVYMEVQYPECAKAQINKLVEQGKMEILHEKDLNDTERNMYKGIYNILGKVMLNPKKPHKNNGEVSSLAMAKVKGIPYFATDERNLQVIVDKLLNTGIDDIYCIRIEDIIQRIKSKEIVGFTRKEVKLIWVLAGKNKDQFDNEIWVI